VTKRAKWWQDARLNDVPEQTRDYIRHYYKRGENISDLKGLGFWFGNGKSNDPWIAAFQAIDESGDKAPLLKLLDVGEPPQPALLADFLRRPVGGSGPRPSAAKITRFAVVVSANSFSPLRNCRGRNSTARCEGMTVEGEVRSLGGRRFGERLLVPARRLV
jgi:hypothetical protein